MKRDIIWLGLIVLVLQCCTFADANTTVDLETTTRVEEQNDHSKYDNDGLRANESTSGNESHNQSHHGVHGIHVASWNFDYVRQPFVICALLLVTAVCKLAFHHADLLSSIVPESCLLIILGTVVGAILHFSGVGRNVFAYFSSQLFFLYLLPPIILESAYSLHDRVFFDNLGTVLLYAVVGTIINCFIVGALLFGLSVGGAMGDIPPIGMLQCLVFSALIAAVDPVAVLAIFQEIGVNNVLYFLVFGESLLNDAVTVVLYNTMKALNVMETIPPEQIGLGFAAFFTVSLGGLVIGIIMGAMSSWFTKYSNHVRVVEPLAIFAFAYSSYLLAELFHFSGIISIIGCGLMQAQYAFHNISHKSYITVTYFSKVMSTTSDCIIFMFLGLALVRDDHVWHTGFIMWTILLSLLIRFLVVYSLTFIANHVDRLRKLDWEEQFIMAYGGLRGAVAFSLVAMLDKNHVTHKSLFETATLAVIIFTVFIQGITIKPLVKLLRIQRREVKVLSIFDEFNLHVTDHVMAGVEEILGYRGSNFVRERLDYYDGHYFKKWLQRDPQTKDDQIMELYQQIALQLHYENVSGAEEMARYSSQMELYDSNKDTGQKEKGLPMVPHPEITNWTLDHYLGRQSVYPDVPHDEGRRRSSVASLGVTGPEEDPDVEDDQSVPTPGKRWNTVFKLLKGHAGGGKQEVKDNPTVNDFRKWLVKNPNMDNYGGKHDKNLVRDSENDLLHHLHEKERRAARMRRARMFTPEGSSYTVSPAMSTEAIPHQARFDVISENEGDMNKANPGARRQTLDIPINSGSSTTSHHLKHNRPKVELDNPYTYANDAFEGQQNQTTQDEEESGPPEHHSLEAIEEDGAEENQERNKDNPLEDVHNSIKNNAPQPMSRDTREKQVAIATGPSGGRMKKQAESSLGEEGIPLNTSTPPQYGSSTNTNVNTDEDESLA